MLNKALGNMYGDITHTWNPIKGTCAYTHAACYCYMRKFGGDFVPVRFAEKELLTDLGAMNQIFIGSSLDMWAQSVPCEYVSCVLRKIARHEGDFLSGSGNSYLFQSKNPARFLEFAADAEYAGIIEQCSFGTTIETNRRYPQQCAAPPAAVRAQEIADLSSAGVRTFVSLEPVLDFDLADVLWLVRKASPGKIYIGADSQGHGLPEPDREKLLSLIGALGNICNVVQKRNLNRLLYGAAENQTRRRVQHAAQRELLPVLPKHPAALAQGLLF